MEHEKPPPYVAPGVPLSNNPAGGQVCKPF